MRRLSRSKSTCNSSKYTFILLTQISSRMKSAGKRNADNTKHWKTSANVPASFYQAYGGQFFTQPVPRKQHTFREKNTWPTKNQTLTTEPWYRCRMPSGNSVPSNICNFSITAYSYTVCYSFALWHVTAM